MGAPGRDRAPRPLGPDRGPERRPQPLAPPRPAADTWRVLAPGPLDGSLLAGAVWAGEEMVVVNQRGSAAYHPGDDRWRDLGPAPVTIPEPATTVSTVWTGRDVVVLAGSDSARLPLAEGGLWQALDGPALLPQATAAAWDGGRVVALSYATGDDGANTATLEPAAAAWAPAAVLPVEPRECYPSVTAVGDQVVAGYCDQPAVWDGATMTWTPLALPFDAGSAAGSPPLGRAGVVVDGTVYYWSAGAFWSVAVPPPPEPSSGPAATDPAFEVLRVLESADEMGTLRSAGDAAALRRMWDEAGFAGSPPLGDFASSVVVVLTIPDDACPPELVGFDRDGDVLTPAFREVTAACIDPLLPRTFVVALDRSSVAPSFTLRLPADPAHGVGEQRLVVDVADGLTSGRASVTLWHCGVETITFDGTEWEVPTDEEPFDATTVPTSFVGEGTIERIDADELRYVDDSGVALRFVPDDGTEPVCG